MALGATRAAVLRTVVYEAAIVVGIGMAFGLALALWPTRLTESFLFEVRPNHALTLSGIFVRSEGRRAADAVGRGSSALRSDPDVRKVDSDFDPVVVPKQALRSVDPAWSRSVHEQFMKPLGRKTARASM